MYQTIAIKIKNKSTHATTTPTTVPSLDLLGDAGDAGVTSGATVGPPLLSPCCRAPPAAAVGIGAVAAIVLTSIGLFPALAFDVACVGSAVCCDVVGAAVAAVRVDVDAVVVSSRTVVVVDVAGVLLVVVLVVLLVAILVVVVVAVAVLVVIDAGLTHELACS